MCYYREWMYTVYWVFLLVYIKQVPGMHKQQTKHGKDTKENVFASSEGVLNFFLPL